MKNILHLDNLEFPYDLNLTKTGVQKVYYTLNENLKDYCNLYSYVSNDSDINNLKDEKIKFIKSNRNSLVDDRANGVDVKQSILESTFEKNHIKNIIMNNNIDTVIMHNARSKFTLKKLNNVYREIKGIYDFKIKYIVHVTPAFIGVTLPVIVEEIISLALNQHDVIFVSKYCQQKWVNKISELKSKYVNNNLSVDDFEKVLEYLSSDRCFIGYFYYTLDSNFYENHDGYSVVLGRASSEKRLNIASKHIMNFDENIKIICSYVEDSSYFDKHIKPVENRKNAKILLNQKRPIVLDELAKSKVLISTCAIEAMGLNIVEALSHGLPVIACCDTRGMSSAYELLPPSCTHLIIPYTRSNSEFQEKLKTTLTKVDDMYCENSTIRNDIKKYADDKFSKDVFINSVVKSLCS